MKTTHYYLLIILLIVTNNLFGQRVQKEDVTFQYIQLPSTPVAGVNHYVSNVILEYEADIITKKEEAQAEYDAAMATYPEQVAAAKEAYNMAMKQYQKEKKAWDEKSGVSKIVEKKVLEEDNEPVKPVYREPSRPYLRTVKHQKIFNKELLTNSYLKVDGLEKGEENALVITVTLYGFDYVNPELKSEQKTRVSKNSNGESSKTKYTVYWYEASYKHAMNLKVETPSGEVLVDEVFEEFNEYTIYRSQSKENSYPQMKAAPLKTRLEEKIVQDNMQIINEFINSRFGYPSIERTTTIRTVKPKKHNYDDYIEAYNLATEGYEILAKDEETAKTKLLEAIVIWEKALTESDVNNKKARINKNVTVATYLNLIEAYIWTNQYDKVNEIISKANKVKLSGKEKSLIDDFSNLAKSQKERWEIAQRV